MNKKGIGLGPILGLILTIIAVLIIASFFLGEGNLLTMVRDWGFSLGLGKLPQDRAPEFSGESVPEQVMFFFEAIVSKIQTNAEGKCLEIGAEVPKKWKSFRIAFYNDKIELEKDVEEGFTPLYKTETIEGFKPCLYYCESTNKCVYCASKEVCNYEEYQPWFANKDKEITPFFIADKDKGNCILIYKDSWTWGNPVKDLRSKYCS